MIFLRLCMLSSGNGVDTGTGDEFKFSINNFKNNSY